VGQPWLIVCCSLGWCAVADVVLFVFMPLGLIRLWQFFRALI
jgi:hypothetical protein